MQVDEHPQHGVLSKPATFSLAAVFGKVFSDVVETTLTGNQPRADFEARRHTWQTEDPTHGKMRASPNARGVRRGKMSTSVTLRPMEVKTFLVSMAQRLGSCCQYNCLYCLCIVLFCVRVTKSVNTY